MAQTNTEFLKWAISEIDGTIFPDNPLPVYIGDPCKISEKVEGAIFTAASYHYPKRHPIIILIIKGLLLIFTALLVIFVLIIEALYNIGIAKHETLIQLWMRVVKIPKVIRYMGDNYYSISERLDSEYVPQTELLALAFHEVRHRIQHNNAFKRDALRGFKLQFQNYRRITKEVIGSHYADPRNHLIEYDAWFIEDLILNIVFQKFPGGIAFQWQAEHLIKKHSRLLLTRVTDPSEKFF